MLVLTRKPLESFFVGETRITVVKVNGDNVRLSIDAPAAVRIRRAEVPDLPREFGPVPGLQSVPELVQS